MSALVRGKLSKRVPVPNLCLFFVGVHHFIFSSAIFMFCQSYWIVTNHLVFDNHCLFSSTIFVCQPFFSEVRKYTNNTQYRFVQIKVLCHTFGVPFLHLQSTLSYLQSTLQPSFQFSAQAYHRRRCGNSSSPCLQNSISRMQITLS